MATSRQFKLDIKEGLKNYFHFLFKNIWNFQKYSLSLRSRSEMEGQKEDGRQVGVASLMGRILERQIDTGRVRIEEIRVVASEQRAAIFIK